MPVELREPPVNTPVLEPSGKISVDWLIFFKQVADVLADHEARITVNDAK